ncbi:MAG: M48 family metallopeptidase, partial [Bacteroides sp.]|nr:M48 family metallopeptidase [Bacteroides sp.]
RGELSAPVSLSDGAELTLLGRRLLVRVREGEDGCREEDGVLTVTLGEPENGARLESLVLGYMAERCRAVLEDAFRRFLVLSGYAGERPTLALKLMKSRWGSCDRGKNTITLNLLLCKLPERFSYYVAAHEVAHLFIPNHSDDFYRFGEALYPGFLATDRELNRVRVGSLFS